jgi:hypothetical protein
MASKLKANGIYKTSKYGSDMWRKEVFIPVKESLQGEFIIGFSFFTTEQHADLNHELSVKRFKKDKEMVSRIRDPRGIYNSLFSQIFSNIIVEIEDPIGWL